MKKFIVFTLLLGAASLWAQDIATVVNVQPRYITVQQQTCTQVPVRDDNSAAGTIIGGVAGGILGHQVGKGTGRDVATVLGAVTGAAVGNRIGSDQTSTAMRQQCTVTPVTIQQGRTVTFNYQGQMFSHTFER